LNMPNDALLMRTGRRELHMSRRPTDQVAATTKQRSHKLNTTKHSKHARLFANIQLYSSNSKSPSWKTNCSTRWLSSSAPPPLKTRPGHTQISKPPSISTDIRLYRSFLCAQPAATAVLLYLAANHISHY
jgi:hypothetical protein